MKQHFQKIDILRGIAILSVFIYHCQSALYPTYEVTKYKAGILDIPDINSFILNFSPSAFGWSGVTLFLIISGFLIHLGYLKNQSDFTTSNFYQKRFWRIFPAYWLVLIFFSISTGGAAYFFSQKKGLIDFISHVFTLHNLTDGTFFSINPSFWSLALEVQLYLIYPLFLYMRQATGVKVTFALILSLSLVLVTAGIKFNNLGDMVSYSNSVLGLWFVWAAGAFYAECYYKGIRIMKRHGFPVFFLSFILLLLARGFVYSNYFLEYFDTLTCILFFDWVLNCHLITTKNVVSKFFISLGLCSYSFYLIHQPFLSTMLNYFNLIPSKYTSGKILNIFPVFLVIFLISYGLYQLIERSSIEFGKKLRKNKNTAQIGAEVTLGIS